MQDYFSFFQPPITTDGKQGKNALKGAEELRQKGIKGAFQRPKKQETQRKCHQRHAVELL